jgi:hypothetical protein
MGFSWAPFLAQTFANVLIKDLGVAWVDNFIVTADSAEEYRRKKDEFLDRARKLNVELDDYDMKPQRQAELLGMYFDLETKTYRLSDDFVKKALLRIDPLLMESSVDGIAAMEAIGSVVWFSYVTQRPLCRSPHMMSLLRNIARAGLGEAAHPHP